MQKIHDHGVDSGKEMKVNRQKCGLTKRVLFISVQQISPMKLFPSPQSSTLTSGIKPESFGQKTGSNIGKNLVFKV